VKLPADLQGQLFIYSLYRYTIRVCSWTQENT